MHKEYILSTLKANLISPTFDPEGMEGTGYLCVRSLSPRLSRWWLCEWITASEFHFGGSMSLNDRVLEVRHWAREHLPGLWIAYCEHDEEIGIRYISHFFFQRAQDAAAFNDWLLRGKSYADCISCFPLGSRILVD